jgi:hypothetical protein
MGAGRRITLRPPLRGPLAAGGCAANRSCGRSCGGGAALLSAGGGRGPGAAAERASQSNTGRSVARGLHTQAASTPAHHFLPACMRRSRASFPTHSCARTSVPCTSQTRPPALRLASTSLVRCPSNLPLPCLPMPCLTCPASHHTRGAHSGATWNNGRHNGRLCSGIAGQPQVHGQRPPHWPGWPLAPCLGDKSVTPASPAWAVESIHPAAEETPGRLNRPFVSCTHVRSTKKGNQVQRQSS